MTLYFNLHISDNHFNFIIFDSKLIRVIRM